MDNPMVSVIMPAYNAEKYIGESIESVIGQTYTNWELIIVDDGSTDKTSEIIKQYQVNNNRVFYIYQENARQGYAKNNGIKHSKGSYIAFIDADDLWLCHKLEICINEIQNGKYDLVFTDCLLFEDRLPYDISTLKNMGVTSAIWQGKKAILAFLHYNRIPNLTVLVKKDSLLKAGSFTNKQAAEEYEMWLKLLANGASFKALNTPLALYRLHTQSVTATDRHATFELIQIIKEFGIKHPAFKARTLEIVNEKLRHWLYHGSYKSTKNLRMLISGLYPPLQTLFYKAISLVLPFDICKKVIVRLI